MRSRNDWHRFCKRCGKKFLKKGKRPYHCPKCLKIIEKKRFINFKKTIKKRIRIKRPYNVCSLCGKSCWCKKGGVCKKCKMKNKSKFGIGRWRSIRKRVNEK